MRPLESIRVVDFSRVLAGPMASQIMAELGAEVIKVERTGSGDESRLFEPRFDDGVSAYFSAFNRSKRSVTLDLKQEEGRALARRLAATADAVIENFMPGKMDEMGLGYDALSADNPGLVYVSNTGFGQDGPYRDRKGYDTVFQAMSGIMHLTGYRDGPPAKAGVPISDLTSALWIVISVLAGLQGRAGTGRGSHVDLAMMDVQVSLLAIAAARYFALGEDVARQGTGHAGRVPSQAFACRGGAMLHISASDQHWPKVCEVLELEELAADAELARNAGRVAQRDRVVSAMAAALAVRDRDKTAAALRAADVPVGEVKTVAEVLEDEQVKFRGARTSYPTESGAARDALGTPVRFSGFDAAHPSAPPDLGDANEAVFGGELGLSAEELAALREKKVI